MVWGLGEVSRTGKLKRTLPTGVSVVIVQRMTPAVSRRMLSTPGSMSVKFVSFEKKLRTTGNGALISILSLNEDLMRNMKSVVSGQWSQNVQRGFVSNVLRLPRSLFIPAACAPAVTRL